MALDGITVAAVASQLKGSILGGRISRVAQPEKDELLMTDNAGFSSPRTRASLSYI